MHYFYKIATLTPENLVHAHLPRSGGLPGTPWHVAFFWVGSPSVWDAPMLGNVFFIVQKKIQKLLFPNLYVCSTLICSFVRR